MTTQTVTITLMGAKIARIFEATCTDGVFNTMTTKTGTLDLNDSMRGAKIDQYRAELAAGILAFRIRNTSTNQIKTVNLGDQLGETRTRNLSKSIVVDDNDQLEAYCDVA